MFPSPMQIGMFVTWRARVDLRLIRQDPVKLATTERYSTISQSVDQLLPANGFNICGVRLNHFW